MENIFQESNQDTRMERDMVISITPLGEDRRNNSPLYSISSHGVDFDSEAIFVNSLRKEIIDKISTKINNLDTSSIEDAKNIHKLIDNMNKNIDKYSGEVYRSFMYDFMTKYEPYLKIGEIKQEINTLAMRKANSCNIKLLNQLEIEEYTLLDSFKDIELESTTCANFEMAIGELLGKTSANIFNKKTGSFIKMEPIVNDRQSNNPGYVLEWNEHVRKKIGNYLRNLHSIKPFSEGATETRILTMNNIYFSCSIYIMDNNNIVAIMDSNILSSEYYRNKVSSYTSRYEMWTTRNFHTGPKVGAIMFERISKSIEAIADRVNLHIYNGISYRSHFTAFQAESEEEVKEWVNTFSSFYLHHINSMDKLIRLAVEREYFNMRDYADDLRQMQSIVQTNIERNENYKAMFLDYREEQDECTKDYFIGRSPIQEK